MKKKSFLILFLIIFCLAMVSTGISIWVISDKKVIKPSDATKEVVEKYLNLSIKENTYTYNGNIQLPAHKKLDCSSLSYFYKKDGDVEWISCSIDEGPVNAGAYDVYVSYTDKNGNTISIHITDANNKFIISKKELAISWDKAMFTYDGYSHMPIASINNSDIMNGDTINLIVTCNDSTIGPIEVGEYTAIASLDLDNSIGDSNYIITNKSFKFSIKSLLQELSIHVEDGQSKTYNGTSQGPNIKVLIETKNLDGLLVATEEIDNAKLDYSYDKLDGNKIDGLPTDAYTYNIHIHASMDGFSDVSTSVNFTIAKKTIHINWSYEEVTYDGNTHGPSVSLSYSDDGSENTVLSIDQNAVTVLCTSQKKAGSYTSNASLQGLKSNNYNIENKEYPFHIKKRPLGFSTQLVEIDYSADKRTFDLIKPLINPSLSQTKDINGNIIEDSGLVVGDTVNINVIGMNDGTFGYGTDKTKAGLNDTNVTGVSSSYQYVVGSTYIASFELTGASANNYIISDDLFVKYKTAKIGNTYYTIEDAITNGSGTITFVGDSSNSEAYVMAAFTNLGDKSPYQTLEFTLDNRTLLVPYNDTTDNYKIEKSSNSNVYSAFYIPESIILNIENSSNLVAASAISYVQPNTTISYNRGVILNNGLINIKSNSFVYSYGYTKGRGMIDLQENATALDCLSTYDWPGGNTSTKIKDTLLPMNAWTLHNISCTTKIAYNANYKAFFYTNASVDVAVDVDIVSSNTQNGLFKGKNGYILKRIPNDEEQKNSNGDYKSIYLITGSNQKAGQKDIIEINGDYEDLVLKVSKSGFDMSTSRTLSCPYSYMNIILKSGSELYLKNSDYLFLPGTVLTVDANATLIVDNGVDLSFEIYDHISDASIKNKSYSFFKNCKDTQDATLIVNGTLICRGNIGGLIQSTEEGATIDFSTTQSLTSSFYSLYHAVGQSARIAYYVSNFYARGYINTADSLKVFNKEVYTSQKLQNGEFVWNGTTYNDSITNLNGTMDVNKVKINCFVEGTLITLADGTKKKVEDLTTDDIVLVFNHETGTYDFIKLLFITHENETASNYNILNLSFSNGTTLRIVGSHGLFDITLRKYVYITYDNVNDYIGHKFYSSKFENEKIVDEIIELTNYNITNENVRIFCPVSAYYMNCFANDILTMPNIPYNEDGLVNIFEYDENLQYNQEKMNQDIEKYGLFTYDDFKEYFSYEAFIASPAKYLKVSIGKGYITYEEVIKIIEYLLSNTLIE